MRKGERDLLIKVVDDFLASLPSPPETRGGLRTPPLKTLFSRQTRLNEFTRVDIFGIRRKKNE